MRQIILDISPNTHQNDIYKFSKMINDIKDVDNGKFEIIIKHQIFSGYNKVAKVNKVIDLSFFELACKLTKNKGYQTTASVFDKSSLNELLKHNIPFVKIANDRELDGLIGYIPRNIMVYRSCSKFSELYPDAFNCLNLICISKYPATYNDYLKVFPEQDLYHPIYGISDHTICHKIATDFQWKVMEFHYVNEFDKDNPDAGPFAIDKQKLQEILLIC